ncbi:MAG: molybdopterin-dependent oxidoreductase, partial [Isosphaeraceae bacterium]
MATIIINGSEYPIPEGEKLNAIQIAKRVGIDVPYYCWHPALSVVANCRMCEIETGAKDPKTGEIKMMPRLVPGCQTPAKDLTVLVTNSPKVKEHQRMIMEYLLLNHPLDCPVCDQAGECGLQDYSYHYGQASHRFVEERLVNPRKDVSDLIQLNQDRCIMCTRCVRFTREITRTGELEVMRRGNHAEITVFPGHTLDANPLAGNVVDICPVGALLDKDFLHKQRVWFLSKHDSVCTRCSTGCNISAEENKGRLWRFKPRSNPHVNDYWMCDEGRYSYKAANDPGLLVAMYVRKNDDLQEVPVDEAMTAVDRGLRLVLERGGHVAGVLSPFLTVEEAYLMARYIKGLNPANLLALGPVPSRGSDVTIKPDQTKGRTGDTSFVVSRPFTIHAEKCPDRRGVEAIVSHFQGAVITFEELSRRVAAGAFQGLYVASDSIDPWIDEAASRALRSRVGFLVLQDTNVTPLAHLADVVLAGATFAEKAGCYVNADGRLQ